MSPLSIWNECGTKNKLTCHHSVSLESISIFNFSISDFSLSTTNAQIFHKVSNLKIEIFSTSVCEWQFIISRFLRVFSEWSRNKMTQCDQQTTKCFSVSQKNRKNFFLGLNSIQSITQWPKTRKKGKFHHPEKNNEIQTKSSRISSSIKQKNSMIQIRYNESFLIPWNWIGIFFWIAKKKLLTIRPLCGHQMWIDWNHQKRERINFQYFKKKNRSK